LRKAGRVALAESIVPITNSTRPSGRTVISVRSRGEPDVTST